MHLILITTFFGLPTWGNRNIKNWHDDDTFGISGIR